MLTGPCNAQPGKTPFYTRESGVQRGTHYSFLAQKYIMGTC